MGKEQWDQIYDIHGIDWDDRIDIEYGALKIDGRKYGASRILCECDYDKYIEVKKKMNDEDIARRKSVRNKGGV